MYQFMSGLSVITVVVLGKRQGKIEPRRKFRLAASSLDMRKNFALSPNGEPVLGPRLYRERTRKELAAAGLEGAEYLRTLVPLCNTGGEPYWVPSVAA